MSKHKYSSTWFWHELNHCVQILIIIIKSNSEVIISQFVAESIQVLWYRSSSNEKVNIETPCHDGEHRYTINLR
jgi:hypothetical protein